MSRGAKRFPTHHGYGDVRVSRYFALYMAQAGWLGLGLYLYFGAFWPSTCTPENVLEVYGCSMMLPESGGWREASLLTWLWATPILILLEISRRFSKGDD
ncbi:hypothetical protein [Alteraurantiacibacter aquimixticola]|uniref:Uncharacterized protein n=1 Tax=Alteraurantiacibacter aquimixticola TaxID=2489173 RepID=A0A4V4U879_9SPHN|nr:hypothetical protein [Alteraurantiacibacter aquimixticola]TIX48877.1 hypothetical protein E5222_14135 [Alteraurantiacibacter aquimixticola]